jgi:hypothetical protein
MTMPPCSCEDEVLLLLAPRVLPLVLVVLDDLLELSTGLLSSVGGVGSPLDILFAI